MTSVTIDYAAHYERRRQRIIRAICLVEPKRVTSIFFHTNEGAYVQAEVWFNGWDPVNACKRIVAQLRRDFPELRISVDLMADEVIHGGREKLAVGRTWSCS